MKNKKNLNNNHKNLIIIITVLVLILLIVLVITNSKNKVTPEELAGEYKNIAEIYISEGSLSLHSRYTIKKDGSLKYEYFNCGEKNEGEIFLSQLDYNKLLKICEENKALSWYDSKMFLDEDKKNIGKDGASNRALIITFEDASKKVSKPHFTHRDIYNFFKTAEEFLDEKTGFSAVEHID